MSRIHYLILMLSLILTCYSGWAQTVLDTLSFQHIRTGMSQTSPTQIFEDSHGFLWIGTPNGLNKFNGTDFQIFEKGIDGNGGLTDGYIESIYEDNNGELYIGTNQGLNIYDRVLNMVKPYPFLAEGQLLQSKYIGAIARTGNLLWLGTDNSGVYRYDTSTGELKQIRFDEIYKGGPSNHYIVEIFPVSENKLLLITQASIYLINHDFQIISQIKEPQNISRALQVAQKEFLLGSHTGELISLSIDNDSFFTESTEISTGHSILAISKDSNGNVWVGSENAGLAIYSVGTGHVSRIKAHVSRPNSISSNSIWAIHHARNGVMWLGSFKNGLSFYDSEYYKFTHHKTDPFKENSLSNNLVNCFIETDDDGIWVGTDGGGLNYWDQTVNTFEEFSLSNGKLHSDVILSFLKDGKKLWIGSWAKGLAILDTETRDYEVWTKENTFLGSNHVTDIMKDANGQIWIITLFGGVHVYNPESGKYKHVTIRSERDGAEVPTVARVIQDKDGSIWIGTQTSGIFRLEKDGHNYIPIHYHSIHEKRSISNDFVNTMFNDSEGNLWVGTQAGLNKYLPEYDSFQPLTKRDGLKNDAIKGIVEDEGFLWLSTGKGVVQYEPKKDKLVYYDQKDGLQGDEFTASASYKSNSGDIYFGGSNGFNAFKAAEIKKRSDVPKVLLSELKVFNKVVRPNDESGILSKDIGQTDTLNLTYDQDVVNLEFNALTYRHPEKVEFAYFLDGFEEDWNYVEGDPHATYTNLNHGTYILRLKSTNSDGVWVDNETSLVINVTPPYWKTVGFRTLLIFLFASTIFLVHRVRVLRLKRHQAVLEDQIAERTGELKTKHDKLMEVADELANKNEEIQRFAFAVSHDLKSPLNSIKGIASLIPMEVDIKQSKDMQEYVQYIDETCDMMTHLIEDISKIARLGKIENKNELLDTNEIVDLASNLVQGRLRERNAKLHVDKRLPKIFGDRNRIVQVFENLIDNAIKYMGDQQDPVVRVEAKISNNTNQFLIVDNGSGMTPEELEKLFTPFERFDGSVEGTGLGLYMVKKIVESHQGSITAKSKGKGEGTTFIINLPDTKSNGNLIVGETRQPN